MNSGARVPSLSALSRSTERWPPTMAVSRFSRLESRKEHGGTGRGTNFNSEDRKSRATTYKSQALTLIGADARLVAHKRVELLRVGVGQLLHSLQHAVDAVCLVEAR